MTIVLALLIFAVLSSVCWFVAVSLYRSTVEGFDPALAPDYWNVTAITTGLVTLTCFVPFPWGYFAALVIYGVAVFNSLGLPTGRGTVLFGYLAAASLVARLVVLGVIGT